MLAIFKTNAMIISDSQAGVFPWVCRANHSCVPNCNYHHNPESHHQQLYSLTNIPAGRELTVSYLPDTGSGLGGRETRQAHLRASHRQSYILYCINTSSSFGEFGNFSPPSQQKV